jgi:8-oxo-dGTP pyrophosphatase MutT (NUDIX family)
MIEKVSAFILRSRNNEPEILIFEHPRAGLQIPAGTVELNESPEEALYREVFEETGLKAVEIIEKIAQEHQFTSKDEAILLQTMRCFGWPAQSAQRKGPLFTRGQRVQVFERKVGFTHINYLEHDYNQEPVELIEQVDGWLPSEMLTQEIIRHFYAVRVKEDTPGSWSQLSDRGQTFNVRWEGLNPDPVLIEAQSEWLQYLHAVSFDKLLV